MSIFLMSAAWRLDMPATKKLTLLALCDWANDEGDRLFPAIATIAARCSVSERTAQRLVHDLIEMGWLEVIGNENGGRPGMTRQYRINAQRIYSEGRATGANLPPVTDDSLTPLRVTNATGGVTNQVETGDTGVTRSTIDPPIEASTKKKGAPAARTTPVKTPDRPDGVNEQTWGDWLALRKAKRAPVTETAIAGIRREAGKAGVTIKTALQACCERGWAGFKAEWYTGPGGNAGDRPRSAVERVARNTAAVLAHPSVATDFRGKSYGTTDIESLPPDMRAAALAALEGEFVEVLPLADQNAAVDVEMLLRPAVLQ